MICQIYDVLNDAFVQGRCANVVEQLSNMLCKDEDSDSGFNCKLRLILMNSRFYFRLNHKFNICEMKIQFLSKFET